MKTNYKKNVWAMLAAGVVAVSVEHSFAENIEHRAEVREHDRDTRAMEARRDREHFSEHKLAGDLKAARDKLAHDQAHHASRKKLAEDDAAIAQIESDMRVAHRR